MDYGQIFHFVRSLLLARLQIVSLKDSFVIVEHGGSTLSILGLYGTTARIVKALSVEKSKQHADAATLANKHSFIVSNVVRAKKAKR